MYFYNPRSLQFYQNGGAIAHGQHLLLDVADFPQVGLPKALGSL